MRNILLFAALTVSLLASAVTKLENELIAYAKGKDARVGVTVIIDGKDTVSVNGGRDFPMLSVYKFPQALAVADYCRRNGIALSDSIATAAGEIKTGTWSPMREKYGIAQLTLPVEELLAYSLQQSDNNACDILFRFIGGTAVVGDYLRRIGFADEITVASTEDEMHRDIYLCYLNRSTPVAMARLLDYFYTELKDSSPEYGTIARLMETASTGADRLVAALPEGYVAGHKTGTGDRNSQGRIIAVNDCGYIVLPSGGRYVIAVFVADSAADMAETSRYIAEISRIVLNNISNNIK